MIKNLILTTFLTLSTSAYSQEAKVPCLNKNGSVGLNGFEKFDCGLASAVVNDPKVKKEFKDKINHNLADKLFTKTSQRLEEIALIDRYYDQLGLDLKNMAPEVGENCKLERIAQPKNCKINQDNMNFLAEKFPKFDNPNIKNIKNPLLRGMIGLTGTARNTKLDDKNRCPVDDSTGVFYLSSQFSESYAENFVVALRKNEKAYIDFFYSSFPQFKMIKEAQSLGPEGAELVKKFEEEIKKGPKPGETNKSLVEKFLRRPEAQAQLGKAIAKKCEVFGQNIRDFLCTDYEHLGMTEDFSDYFFDSRKDKDAEVDKVVAKGFSCKMVDPKKSEDELFIKGNTVEAADIKFTADTRKPTTQFDIEKAKPFCKMYSCSDAKVKMLDSCKSGGPISSSDYNQYCKDTKCGPDELQFVSFLLSLEIEDGKVVNQQLASYAPELTEQVKAKKGFSTFYQNFMGVEGTLLSEKKEITPITIAEKKAEFAEKKIESAPISQMLTQKEMAKVEVREDTTRMIARQDSDFEPSSQGSNTVKDNDPFRRTFNTTQFAKNESTTSQTVKGKRQDFSEAESRQTDEMRKLRTELAEAIAKVKGTEEEKLETIADSNAMTMAPKGVAKEVAKKLSTAEKDRLDDYRDSLNNWENRLRNWQGQLSDRDVRAANSVSASGSMPSAMADNRNNMDSNSGPSEGYGGANGANGAKLTKVAAGGANGLKGDGGAERAPGAEKVEGDLPVVSSEKLATLQVDNLKTLGIVATDSFVINVRHQDKIYSIPVKTFNHDGKSMFVPLLNDNNRELSKIVFESPLFKDYKKYQLARQSGITAI